MLSREEHFNSNQDEYKEAFLLRVLIAIATRAAAALVAFPKTCWTAGWPWSLSRTSSMASCCPARPRLSALIVLLFVPSTCHLQTGWLVMPASVFCRFSAFRLFDALQMALSMGFCSRAFWYLYLTWVPLGYSYLIEVPEGPISRHYIPCIILTFEFEFE